MRWIHRRSRHCGEMCSYPQEEVRLLAHHSYQSKPMNCLTKGATCDNMGNMGEKIDAKVLTAWHNLTRREQVQVLRKIQTPAPILYKALRELVKASRQ